MHDLEIAIAAIIVLGVGALWLADRLRIPAILLLLGAGVAAGPWLDVVEPSKLLGDTLFPAVSLAVAVLLFDGGLQLRWDALEQRGVLLRLVTVGVIVTWLIGWFTATLVFDVPAQQAALIGAILTVSGPTVVLPLLRQVGVRQPLDGILRWEGIVIDPIGATLAVVAFEVASNAEAGATDAVTAVALTAVVGCAAGGVAAFIIIQAFSRGFVADRLHVAVTLAALVAAWAASNYVASESGLFATTVLGVILANQRTVPVAHIAEFGENLGLIILGPLFVVLGATVDLDLVREYGVAALILAAVLVLVARPLTTVVSTAGTALRGNERIFIAAMAPRGIVAASVSAVFGLRLAEEGLGGEFLAPATFVVVVATVVVYGLSARPLARRLRLAKAPGRGLVIVGAPEWAFSLADEALELGLETLFVTAEQSERDRVSERGYLAYNGPVTRHGVISAVDGAGGVTVLAVSDREEANTLVLEWLAEHLGRSHLVHLPTAAARTDSRDAMGTSLAAWGKPLLGLEDQDELQERLESGWTFAATTLGAVADGEVPLVLVPADTAPSFITSEPTRDGRDDVPVVVLQPATR